jgi:hemerythrin
MSDVFFKWDQDFNTGNSIIDLQHITLVDMINDLLKLSVNNESISLDKVDKIGVKLSNYVEEHFSTEENLMKSHLIDQRHVKEHERLHREFINEISKHFNDTFQLQNHKNINEIVEYLIRWLAYHILNTDQSLVRQIEYIIEKGTTPTEAFEMEKETIELSTEPLLKALKVLYVLVSKKNKEIEQKNKELEEKVQQRTSELLAANEKLSQMLLHDHLTGLCNRRFVMLEIQKLLLNWERYKVPFSVLFLDIDKFKAINDNYGHENGDKVLIWFANFLKRSIRKTDIACRLGGDEFVIICTHTDKVGAKAIGEKLNIKCFKECRNELEFWEPSISIGIATIDDSIKSPSELIKIADLAMYRSKADGGGKTSL